MPIAARRDGVEIAVRLTPGARATRVVGLHRDGDGVLLLKVQVTDPPEDGRANAALLAFLARQWRLPKTALRVAAGERDRRKRIAVAGESADLLARLQPWFAALAAPEDAG